jgi:hypothetical protein
MTALGTCSIRERRDPPPVRTQRNFHSNCVIRGTGFFGRPKAVNKIAVVGGGGESESSRFGVVLNLERGT